MEPLLIFGVPVIVGTLMVRNRGVRGLQPVPRVARTVAALAGMAWIVGAFEFLLVALSVAIQNAAVSYNPDYVPYRVPRLVFVGAITAAPVTLLLGLLLLFPTRRVLVWSMLWAATVVVAAAVVAVAWPDLQGGWLSGTYRAFVFYVAFPVVAGVLSLLAWRQLPSEPSSSPAA